MRIKVLPEEVASAIAAGEVVERPASVVKELIENSIDAGANEIRIEVVEAGRSRITVADNGEGIQTDELELALSRHATSKLSSRDDLFAISTLGFRGEALPSIASVSRFEMTSRARQQAEGRFIVIEGGARIDAGSVGAPTGTSVHVRDLFYNVPARREFLKSDRTEQAWISDYVQRYALAYPSIRFELTLDGRPAFQSSGRGQHREILAEIFGIDRAHSFLTMAPVDAGQIRLEGYLSPPIVNRSNRKELTFFVNGRWIQDAALSAAVIQAYHGLLMVGRYPMTVLFLEVPAGMVDVNVHPAKSEVRFREPGQVFRVVQRAVRATLLKQAPPPSLESETQLPSGFPVQVGWGDGEGSQRWPEFPEPPLRSLELLPAEAGSEIPLLRSIGQIGASYLVAEGPEGLYLIDQHAAHERILFEKLMGEMRAGELESQGLLEPVTVEMSPQEAALLEPQIEVLQGLGFGVESFGSNTYRIRSLPVLLMNLDPAAALRSVVEDFEEDERPLEKALEEKVAARVCKRAAVKAGQVLSLEEQRQLVRQLEACQSPRACPHGRPTMIHMSVDSLARQFGRRG